MRLPRRLRMIAPYLAFCLNRSATEGEIGLGECLKFLFQPSETKRGERYIESVSPDGEDLRIAVRGLSRPIYFPAEFSFAAFCATVSETLDAADWHHFTIPETSLESGQVVIDCGMAEGLFALRAAEAGCRVLGFEPLPRFQACLHRSFSGLEDVEVVPAAVGARPGTVALSRSEMGSKIGLDGDTTVPVVTLDDELERRGARMDYLKADVEGFEYEMLLGAERMIRRDRPKVAITVYHDENNLRQIRRFLEFCHPDYRFRAKGMALNGHAVMLHAW